MPASPSTLISDPPLALLLLLKTIPSGAISLCISLITSSAVPPTPGIKVLTLPPPPSASAPKICLSRSSMCLFI